MKELVLNELKVYAQEVNSKAMQGVRQHVKLKNKLINKFIYEKI